MTLFADEVRAGIDKAARKVAQARLDGDDSCAEAYRERLWYLWHAAGGHGVELLPRRGPVADREPPALTAAELAGRKRRD